MQNLWKTSAWSTWTALWKRRIVYSGSGADLGYFMSSFQPRSRGATMVGAERENF